MAAPYYVFNQIYNKITCDVLRVVMIVQRYPNGCSREQIVSALWNDVSGWTIRSQHVRTAETLIKNVDKLLRIALQMRAITRVS